MDQYTKFFRFNEDPFKEPSIQPAVKLETSDQYPSLPLTEDKLLEFDDLVNEKGGCWVYLDKLPPVEEEDPKKAKAPPKGGKVPTEELKPVYGRAWVNLVTFREPGM